MNFLIVFLVISGLLCFSYFTALAQMKGEEAREKEKREHANKLIRDEPPPERGCLVHDEESLVVFLLISFFWCAFVENHFQVGLPTAIATGIAAGVVTVVAFSVGWNRLIDWMLRVRKSKSTFDEK